MWRYLARRLIGAVFVLWLVSIFVFLVVRGLPGDAVLVKLGEAGRLSDEQMQAARAEMGLDDPVLLAYVKWFGNLAKGDLGDSIIQEHLSVFERIRKALVPTVELGLIASVIGLPLAIGLGAISAVKQDTWLDYPLRTLAVMAISVPNFVLATALITFLSRQLGYAPSFRWISPWEDPLGNLSVIYMPALILAVGFAGTITRMTRSAVLEVMRQDYVRTARAKGLTGFAVFTQHIMRNALVSVTTLLGMQVIFLVSGSVILEVIFALPGVGRLTLTAIQQRDYPQIMGNTMFFATVVVMSNLAVDMLYGVIDPRVRYA